MKLKLTNGGFSLLELLVTVSIIGILAGISISLYDNYKRRTNDMIAISSLKNILTAFEAAKDELPTNTNYYSIVDPDGSIQNYDTPIASISDILPGYVHNLGVGVLLHTQNTSSLSRLEVAHCYGSKWEGDSSYASRTTVYSTYDSCFGYPENGSYTIQCGPEVNLPQDGSSCP